MWLVLNNTEGFGRGERQAPTQALASVTPPRVEKTPGVRAPPTPQPAVPLHAPPAKAVQINTRVQSRGAGMGGVTARSFPRCCHGPGAPRPTWGGAGPGSSPAPRGSQQGTPCPSPLAPLGSWGGSACGWETGRAAAPGATALHDHERTQASGPPGPNPTQVRPQSPLAHTHTLLHTYPPLAPASQTHLLCPMLVQAHTDMNVHALVQVHTYLHACTLAQRCTHLCTQTLRVQTLRIIESLVQDHTRFCKHADM